MEKAHFFFDTKEEAAELLIKCLEKGIFAEYNLDARHCVSIDIKATLEAKYAKTKK